MTCRNRDTFYAVGIATKNRKFDGVYLARKDGDELLYAGKVERGFSDEQVLELKARLEPYRARAQPLTSEFRALTGARKVRHPSYKGIREELTDAPDANRQNDAGKAGRRRRPRA